jgi:hypothetical protein
MTGRENDRGQKIGTFNDDYLVGIEKPHFQAAGSTIKPLKMLFYNQIAA